VLNKNIQLDKFGKGVDKANQIYIYEESIINRVDIPLSISDNDDGTESVKHLIHAMEVLLGQNFIAGLFVMAGMLIPNHFGLIYKYRKACPMVMAYGPTKCGKTTALNCAAARHNDMGHNVK